MGYIQLSYLEETLANGPRSIGTGERQGKKPRFLVLVF